MGPAGPRGPAGDSANRADILAVVEDQFSQVRKELTIQLQRMAQLQQQFDGFLKRAEDLQRQLDEIHALVKRLVADVY